MRLIRYNIIEAMKYPTTDPIQEVKDLGMKIFKYNSASEGGADTTLTIEVDWVPDNLPPYIERIPEQFNSN